METFLCIINIDNIWNFDPDTALIGVDGLLTLIRVTVYDINGIITITHSRQNSHGLKHLFKVLWLKRGYSFQLLTEKSEKQYTFRSYK